MDKIVIFFKPREDSAISLKDSYLELVFKVIHRAVLVFVPDMQMVKIYNWQIQVLYFCSKKSIHKI